jgi:bacterioferritin
MKTDAKVIEYLNEYLGIELTGHRQYMLAAAAANRWGYARMEEKQEAYVREESEHALRIARRILFLEGVPVLGPLGTIDVASSVDDQLRKDHGLVSRAIVRLREAVTHCIQVRDDGTRELLTEMLVDEESHLHWLESQLTLVDQLGLQSYLQQQMRA